MSMYVNEVNVVNQNQPPSSEKVIGQLMRKRQSQIALPEIPLVEFHEDLSRAPYSRRTKVKFPECLDIVYALGLKEGGWLSDRHLDAWFELMWSFRPTYADWAIAISYFCELVMRGDIPGWVCNRVTYPVMWANVEQEHYCLGIRTGVITLYDSLYSKAVETRKWWIKIRKAFKKYIPPYLQEWGILDAKGIPLESYNINFVVGKDVLRQGDAYGDCGVWVCIFLYRLIHKVAVSAKDPQIVGLAYREHMFDYFWKYKIPNWSLYFKCGFEVFEVKDEDDMQFFINEVCGQSEIVHKLCVKKIKEHKKVKVVVQPVNDFDLKVSLFPNDYNDQTDNLPKWQVNTFTHMPISPPLPQPYIKKSRVEYHGISLGDDFANKMECMYTIGVKSLRESFEYAVIKSCSKSLYFKCGFEVFEVKDEDDMQFFINEVCGQSEIVHKLCVKKIKEHKKVNTFTHMPISPPLPQPYIKKSRVEYHGISLGDDFANKMECMYTIGVKSLRESFEYAVIKSCSKRSFLRYMRPLIIFDGARLKGNYLGTNLLAVGMDGNNQIIPLATGKKLHGIFWKACKAYTTEDFDKSISKLRGHRPEVVRKLEAGFEKWSRAYCLRSRYNYMTSNSVESINSFTRIAHRVPITMLVEYCRELLQRST
nr:phospholipase-like protein [Tanacetum cinerariifolium]